MLSVWLVVSGSQQYTSSDNYKKVVLFKCVLTQLKVLTDDADIFFPRCMHLHLTLFSILSAEKVWKKLAYYCVCMEQTLIMSIRRSLTHSALMKYQYNCKNADFYSYLPPTTVLGCQSSYSGVIKK